MTYGLLIAFALVHYFMQPQNSIRRTKSSILFYYLKEAIPFFALCGLLFAISEIAKRFLPVYLDLLPFVLLLAAFGWVKALKRPEYFAWMAFCVWFLGDLQKAAVISLGLPIIRGALEGIRFRLALSPGAPSYNSLPGILTLTSLVALVLSGFFAFSR